MSSRIVLFQLTLLLGCAVWCVCSKGSVVTLAYPRLNNSIPADRQQMAKMIERLHHYGWESIASAVSAAEHPSASAPVVSRGKGAKGLHLFHQQPSSVSSHLTLRKVLALLFSPPQRRASELLSTLYALDSMLLTEQTGQVWPASFTQAGFYSRRCVLDSVLGVEHAVHHLTTLPAQSVRYVRAGLDPTSGLGSLLHIHSSFLAQALDRDELLLHDNFGRHWLESDHFATACAHHSLLCLLCPSEYYLLAENSNSSSVAGTEQQQQQQQRRTATRTRRKTTSSLHGIPSSAATERATEGRPIDESTLLHDDEASVTTLALDRYRAPRLIPESCLAKVDSPHQFWRSVALYYVLRPTASLARRLASFFGKHLRELEQLQPCVAVFCRRGDKVTEERWAQYRLPDAYDYWRRYVESMGDLPVARWKNVFLTTDSSAVVNTWTELWRKKFARVKRPPRLVLLDTQREPDEWLAEHSQDTRTEYNEDHVTVVDAHDTARILVAKTVSLLCDSLYSTQASNSLRLMDELRRVLHPWRAQTLPHTEPLPQTFFDTTEPSFPRGQVW